MRIYLAGHSGWSTRYSMIKTGIRNLVRTFYSANTINSDHLLTLLLLTQLLTAVYRLVKKMKRRYTLALNARYIHPMLNLPVEQILAGTDR